MMTALQIEDRRDGFLRLLRHNRLRVEHRYCDTAALKCITYEHYRGRIGWNAIDRFVKAQRNRVLCSESVELPADCGYKRFVSWELNRRMCENAALYLLRTVDCRGIKVALVDRSGDSVGLCECLVDYCDPVYVVSDAVEIYAAQAEHLLNEKGAALRLCRSADCLHEADLIIAPDRLDTVLPCARDALILSGEPSDIRQNADTIDEYYFDLPSKYRELCPAFLSEMYFASALYTMANARELSSEIFTRCKSGCVLHTRASLSLLLKNRLNQR